jgi:cytochrome c biogenesis protein CcdA
MSRAASLFLPLFALVLSLLPGAASGQESTVRMFLFKSKDCEHCQVIINQFLPPIQEKYGSRLEVRTYEVSDPQNYQLMLDLEERYGFYGQEFPEVFIGDDALAGEEQIRQQLDGLIQKYLDAGGVDFPSTDFPVEPSPVATPSDTSPAIHAAYFYQVGCQECNRFNADLDRLRSQFPGLKVEAYDVHAVPALAQWFGQRYDVPQEKRLTAPAVFVGEDYLVGDEVTEANLSPILERYRQTGALRLWAEWEDQRASLEGDLVQRFRQFGPLTVAIAGLVDGLNPCAFATIIFLISYLTLYGGSRKEVLLSGIAFTAGVFITYLLAGLGALTFIRSLGIMETLGRVIYIATGLLCLGLGVLSLYDYIQFRRGRPETMVLRLPRLLQRQVHSTIRERRGSLATVPGALITGSLVSLLELTCTGQVYLPTIMFVLSVPELQAQALAYLVMYNVMFIVPLVAIFLLAYFGTTSQQLGRFLQTRGGIIKLVTAIIFFALGAWLLLAV